ncbi:hypothetical protein MAP00_001679 [Monascus purpureus]|nr:hypothetical protein MAP00_001679 [Monascus purpureus]
MTANANTWAWLGVVLAIVLLRYVSRVMHKSIKNLQMEDGLMLFTVACYVILTAILILVSEHGTNEIPPSQFGQIDPESIPDRIYGSKLVIVTEQMWLATIWGCKGCLLLLYSTMTMGLSQHRIVILMGGFCALSYIVIEILFFALWCRPFSNYWSVPPANLQCSVYRNHLILVLALNVSSDFLMLFIPLPILIRARLTLIKKLTLCALFSLGAFVIICCILSKYYSLSQPYGQEWVDWYVREAGTAVIVANIPHIWPLVRRLLNARDFLSNGSFSRTRKTHTSQRGGSSMPLSTMRANNSNRSTAMRSILSRTSSENDVERSPGHLEIWEHKQFQVTEEPGYPSSDHNSSDGSPSMEYGVALSPSGREELRTKTTVTTAL